MKSGKFIAALGLTALALAACQTGTSSAGQIGGASLAGTQWALLALNGQPPVGGTAPTAEFSETEISGSTGCNHYFGSYEVAGSDLTIGQVGMTEMYCVDPEGVMEQEQAFLAALMSVASYRMTENRLEMLNSTGGVVLEFAAPAPMPEVTLEGTEWLLTTFVEGEAASSLISGTTITLQFEGDIVRGSAGCNDYGGPYTLAAGALQIGALDMTDQLCVEPPGIMEQEARYIDILGRATIFELDANQLTLRTTDELGLVFVAEMEMAAVADPAAPALATPLSLAPAIQDASADAAPYEVIFEIPVGEEGVIYEGAGVAEMQVSGPTGFAVAPDGSFWIDDARGYRLLHYSASGERLGTLSLEPYQVNGGQDIIATDRGLLLLDIDFGRSIYRVLLLSYAGELLGEYELPRGLWLEDGLTGIAAGEQGEVLVELQFGGEVWQLVDPSGALNPARLDGYAYGGQLYRFEYAQLGELVHYILAGDRRIGVATTMGFGGLYLLRANPDGSFYAVTDDILTDTPFIQSDQVVRYYDAEGELLGMARVPLAEWYFWVQRSLSVGPDGEVYHLLTTPDGIEIVRLNFFQELAPLPIEMSDG